MQTPLCNEINQKNVLSKKLCWWSRDRGSPTVTAASGEGEGGGVDLGGASLFIQLMNQKAENGCCTLGPSDRARRVIYEFTGHEDNADLKSVNIYLYGSDGVQ